jgi:hypothetical protein
MRSLLRLLVIASLMAMYGVNPSTLRPLYQLLANPTTSIQRAETLAQWLVRVDSVKNLLRSL